MNNDGFCIKIDGFCIKIDGFFYIFGTFQIILGRMNDQTVVDESGRPICDKGPINALFYLGKTPNVALNLMNYVLNMMRFY